MKTLALILTLAISAIAISAAFVPASAGKMDGKGMGTSDGGRSAKAKGAVKHGH